MAIPDYLTGDRAVLETVSRQQCQEVDLGDGTVLCRVLGKYLVYAAAADNPITPHLCRDGFWESWITLAIARLLRPDWHCIDVGANHGYYTLIMADAAERTGRVLAVEPNPGLAELLDRSLKVNGLQFQASVLQKAVSDTNSRTVDLVIPRNGWSYATMCRPAAAGDDVVKVETTTLDELTGDWPRVDLVKVDAEGAEEAVWRGMRRTVERNPEVAVIMEVGCARSANPAEFLRDIEGAGFPLRHIDYDGTVKPVTEDRVLTTRIGKEWMLFLQRS